MTDTIDKLSGSTELDDYAIFVTGCTPEYVAKVVEKTASRLTPDQVSHFTNTCLLAATGQRKLVETLIRKPNQAPLLVYLRDNFWSNQNQLNFSALSLIGHCLLAATSRTSNNMILTFQLKLRANFIWEADLRKSYICYRQRRVFEELVAKHTKADADAAGSRIRTALTAQVAPVNIADRKTSTSASQTVDDNDGNNKGGLGNPDINNDEDPLVDPHFVVPLGMVVHGSTDTRKPNDAPPPDTRTDSTTNAPSVLPVAPTKPTKTRASVLPVAPTKPTKTRASVFSVAPTKPTKTRANVLPVEPRRWERIMKKSLN